MAKRRKQGGRFTEPDLPPRLIVDEGGVTIEHLYRSGDHGPPHLHVSGQGNATRVGQNGKPIERSPPLSADQEAVIAANRRAIRKAVRKIGSWHWYQSLP
jgi:hypothetical protein